MRILIDLDMTVADLLGTLIPLHNEENGDDFTIERMLTWEIQDHCRPGTADKLVQLFARQGLFWTLKPLPGAVEAVKELNENHDVYIVTAAEHPSGFSEKARWVHEYLPFSQKRRFILAHDKHLIRADVLIDDKPATIQAMRAEQPFARTYGILYPYNAAHGHAYTLLAPSWKDTATAWNAIVSDINDRS